MSTLKSIEGLLEKPVYMMTGEEYLENLERGQSYLLGTDFNSAIRLLYQCLSSWRMRKIMI